MTTRFNLVRNVFMYQNFIFLNVWLSKIVTDNTSFNFPERTHCKSINLLKSCHMCIKNQIRELLNTYNRIFILVSFPQKQYSNNWILMLLALICFNLNICFQNDLKYLVKVHEIRVLPVNETKTSVWNWNLYLWQFKNQILLVVQRFLKVITSQRIKIAWLESFHRLFTKICSPFFYKIQNPLKHRGFTTCIADGQISWCQIFDSFFYIISYSCIPVTFGFKPSCVPELAM